MFILLDAILGCRLSGWIRHHTSPRQFDFWFYSKILFRASMSAVFSDVIELVPEKSSSCSSLWMLSLSVFECWRSSAGSTTSLFACWGGCVCRFVLSRFVVWCCLNQLVSLFVFHCLVVMCLRCCCRLVVGVVCCRCVVVSLCCSQLVFNCRLFW